MMVEVEGNLEKERKKDIHGGEIREGGREESHSTY